MSVWHYAQLGGTGKRFNVDKRKYEEAPCQRKTDRGRLCGLPATTKMQSGGRHDYYCGQCVAELIEESGAVLTKITDE
jgi:hypothetical protein